MAQNKQTKHTNRKTCIVSSHLKTRDTMACGDPSKERKTITCIIFLTCIKTAVMYCAPACVSRLGRKRDETVAPPVKPLGGTARRSGGELSP